MGQTSAQCPCYSWEHFAGSSCLLLSSSPLGANPGGAHYGVATFRVNNLYSVASLNEVWDNDRCRCHQTLINSSRTSLSPGGEGGLQCNAFPFGHGPWDSSVAEIESPREGITT